ncbi:MAG: DUF5320 domain-containing protein [Promethearchaeia archaeon]
MPRGDQTGPNGQGPMTGRGLGLCSGSNTPGFMKNQGVGFTGRSRNPQNANIGNPTIGTSGTFLARGRRIGGGTAPRGRRGDGRGFGRSKGGRGRGRGRGRRR